MDSNERLTNYCLNVRSTDAAIPIELASVIDYRIKREGYMEGIGIEQMVDGNYIAPIFYPLLEYDTNVNGGNPQKPLKLGNITLRGDSALKRKESLVYGGGVGAVGRVIYGPGKYIDYSSTVSRKRSLKYGLSIDTIFARACSKNHLGNWWYLDGCAFGFNEEKSLSKTRVRQISASMRKLLSSDRYRHHEISITPIYFKTENYKQEQIELGLENLHQGGEVTSFHFLLGNDIGNQTGTEMRFKVGLKKIVAGKSIGLRWTRSRSNQTTLLGFDRRDKSDFIGFNIRMNPRVELQFGYSKTDSTIDYFDRSGFLGSINITPFSL